MSSDASGVMTCEKCGATVYPEMIEAGRAGEFDGKLECPHCYREDLGLESSQLTGSTIAETLGVPGIAEDSTAPPPPPKKPEGPKVTYTGGGIAFQREYDEGNFKRPLLTGSRNATRCRTFHAKLTDASLAHLDDLINEWADSHEDIEIKFVTASMGVVEGKHADPHYILTCWY